MSSLSILKSVSLALFLCVSLFLPVFANLTFRTTDLTLTTRDGAHHLFHIEIAETEPQREQGLMFRRDMADDSGMLFIFGKTRRVQMWMKNTFLPLDMIFLDREGKIASIAKNTVPMSEDIIDSGEDVDFVLEVKAGTAARLGLEPGDTALWDGKSPAGP